MVMTFDYANNRWAGGNKVRARLWYEELERNSPFLVRHILRQSYAGPATDVMIGNVSMPKGFAQDWLTHLDERNGRQILARISGFVQCVCVLVLAAIPFAYIFVRRVPGARDILEMVTFVACAVITLAGWRTWRRYEKYEKQKRLEEEQQR
jgi:hypothetical protein